MRVSGSSLAAAFAFANFYLLALTGPLISPSHELTFHLPGSALPVFAPVLLDLGACTALLASLLDIAARRRSRSELLLWSALLCGLPSTLTLTVAGFMGRPANLLWLLPTIFASSAAFAFIAARPNSLLPLFWRTKPALDATMGSFATAGLLILAQLLWNGWECRRLNVAFAPQPPVSAQRPAASPRVVWVILDEFSFEQTFGHRAPQVALPNLDQLAAEATVLTRTQAAAEYTRIAVPSLLTGLPLRSTRPTADGQHLLLQEQNSPHWRALDPAGTVFGDTRAQGLPTGVAGWYEPYCRLLPTVLDRCFWTYRDDLPGGMSAAGSVLGNAAAPLRTLLGESFAALREATGAGYLDYAGRADVARHAADLRDLVLAGDRLLAAQHAGLVLLHLPIPHPWGFYDRRTGTFPSHRTSFLDNLALADLYIGHLRAQMTADGTWDSTTLVIMGDHGWRAGLVWRRSGFWTNEEEAASRGGTLADCPAVLIKLAGQHTPDRLGTPFAAYRTRPLLDALLAGQVQTPQQLATWFQQAR